MKLPKNRVLRETLCTHFALRRLGFDPDNIEIKIMPHAARGGIYSFCEIRAQGKKFLVCCGVVDEEAEAFFQVLKRVTDAIQTRTISNFEINEAWRNCYVRQNLASLVVELKKAGFVLHKSKLN